MTNSSNGVNRHSPLSTALNEVYQEGKDRINIEIPGVYITCLEFFDGTIDGTYEIGCKLERKRVECALMVKAALALEGETDNEEA